MSSPSLLGLVERLTEVTEQALDAAKELRAADLRLLDRRRADLVFELQLEVRSPPDLESHERIALREALEHLRSLESRLERVARVVTHALRPPGPPKPVIYAPTGTLRG